MRFTLLAFTAILHVICEETVVTDPVAEPEKPATTDRDAAASKETQGIVACWLLTIEDNTANDDVFEKLVQAIDSNTTEPYHIVQIHMIKKCFPVINREDAQTVLAASDDSSIVAKKYRDIVPKFEYTQVLEDYKNQSQQNKSQQIDDVLLMFIQELEIQFGFNEPDSEHEPDTEPEGKPDL